MLDEGTEGAVAGAPLPWGTPAALHVTQGCPGSEFGVKANASNQFPGMNQWSEPSRPCTLCLVLGLTQKEAYTCPGSGRWGQGAPAPWIARDL